MDRPLLVVMEATGISASARVVLLCLIGLLLVILGFLIAFAFLIRRRGPTDTARVAAERPVRSPARSPRETGPVTVMAGGDAGLGASVARSEAMVCPTCRSEYESLLDFCPRDARRLVPLGHLDGRTTGCVCPACRRGFEPGTRFCSHDGSELLPVSLHEATRSDADLVGTGAMCKICPQCRSRHDLAASFCGRDGSELVALN